MGGVVVVGGWVDVVALGGLVVVGGWLGSFVGGLTVRPRVVTSPPWSNHV